MASKNYNIILLTFLAIQSLAQIDTIYNQLRNLEILHRGNKEVYLIDKKVVTKEVYEKALQLDTSIMNCKPCWLRHLNQNNQVIWEGNFMQDLCIGTFMERYGNGKIKVKGQFKDGKGGHFAKSGNWIYYKITGDIQKTEVYEEGVLIKLPKSR